MWVRHVVDSCRAAFKGVSLCFTHTLLVFPLNSLEIFFGLEPFFFAACRFVRGLNWPKLDFNLKCGQGKSGPVPVYF